jgi:hypothetical protein
MSVNVSNVDGSPISDVDYQAINNFAHLFEYGRYDGQHDLYESYESSGLKTDNGTKIEAGVKYVSVENRPAWDTPQYVLNCIRTGEYTWDTMSKYISPKAVEQARTLAG